MDFLFLVQALRGETHFIGLLFIFFQVVDSALEIKVFRKVVTVPYVPFLCCD